MAGGTQGGPGLVGDQGVVHLEEHRGFGPAGQVQHPGQRPVPGVPGHRDQVVVELTGHEHLVRGLLDLGQQLVRALLAAQRGPEVRLAEGGPQGPGQVALGQVTGPVAAPSTVHGASQQQAGGRVEEPGGGQFLGYRAAPQQGHVQRDARHVHPRVQPVDPPGPPGYVHPDEQRAGDDQDDVGDHGKSLMSGATATRVRPSMTVSYTRSTSRATTDQSYWATAASAAADSSARRAGSSSRRPAARARSAASPVLNSSPASPPSSTWRNASMSLATTGRPAAIASAVTMPNDSPPVLGEQKTSTECSTRTLSSSLTCPSSTIRSRSPAGTRDSTSSASAAGPATSSRSPGRSGPRISNALSRTARPLRGSSSRPRKPMAPPGPGQPGSGSALR